MGGFKFFILPKKNKKKMFMFTRFKRWKIKLEDVERRGWRNGVRATIKRAVMSCTKGQRKAWGGDQWRQSSTIRNGIILVICLGCVLLLRDWPTVCEQRCIFHFWSHFDETSVYTLIYLFMKNNNNNKYE